MVSNNIPQVKLGIIAVSRDCFPIALSTQRRENIVKEYKGEIFNCQTTVENEKDMLKAVAEVKEQGCNALVVFLGNFGPETPETLIAKNFDGPVMFVAAAECDGDMINGRGSRHPRFEGLEDYHLRSTSSGLLRLQRSYQGLV